MCCSYTTGRVIYTIAVPDRVVDQALSGQWRRQRSSGHNKIYRLDSCVVIAEAFFPPNFIKFEIGSGIELEE